MRRRSVAVVGGGVSGLSCAQLLREFFDVTVFEREATVGGLIRCVRVQGSLFHICGGHVFNTKNQRVSDWFWSKFDRERDFIKADRRSAVCLENGSFVDYPIEDHVYQLDDKTQQGFIADIRDMIRNPPSKQSNFGEFLLHRFGRTLYDLYFKPYNVKVWRRDLSEVPLSWLAGKLPMPTIDEMLLANMNHIEEKKFVHSTFYYAKKNGSQIIADALSRGIQIETGCAVKVLQKTNDGWLVDGRPFDIVIFCGNLKDLPTLLRDVELGVFETEIRHLESHGTTAVFCETDPIPYSWFYQPSGRHQSHRFICTGNFSSTNNAPGKMTCTVEFTDEISTDEIKRQLVEMPFHPQYITQQYSPFTYPIQHLHTRETISGLKKLLAKKELFLCGRFAEWEYFNMDAAMASAFALSDQILKKGE